MNPKQARTKSKDSQKSYKKISAKKISEFLETKKVSKISSNIEWDAVKKKMQNKKDRLLFKSSQILNSW